MAYDGTNPVNGERWFYSGKITLKPEYIKDMLEAGLEWPPKASKPVEIITEDIEYEDVTVKRLDK